MLDCLLLHVLLRLCTIYLLLDRMPPHAKYQNLRFALASLQPAHLAPMVLRPIRAIPIEVEAMVVWVMMKQLKIVNCSGPACNHLHRNRTLACYNTNRKCHLQPKCERIRTGLELAMQLETAAQAVEASMAVLWHMLASNLRHQKGKHHNYRRTRKYHSQAKNFHTHNLGGCHVSSKRLRCLACCNHLGPNCKPGYCIRCRTCHHPSLLAGNWHSMEPKVVNAM